MDEPIATIRRLVGDAAAVEIAREIAERAHGRTVQKVEEWEGPLGDRIIVLGDDEGPIVGMHACVTSVEVTYMPDEDLIVEARRRYRRVR